MDAPHVFSSNSASRHGGVPAPLDGEIILPHGRAKPGADPAPAVPPPPSSFQPSAYLIGTVALSLIALSAAGGYFTWDRAQTSAVTAATVRQMQHDLGAFKNGLDALKNGSELARQDETIRTVKKSVDALRAELEASRSASTNTLAQLSTKIDRTDHDPAGKLADIAARIDKLETPGAKLSDIMARLDRIERQVSSATPTGSIAPAAHPFPAPVQQVSAAMAQEKQVSKPVALGNWIVRDVYDGIALVEGRSGGIREVTPGEFLPGAGEVRSIERHGRNWIVVTSRGVINDSTW